MTIGDAQSSNRFDLALGNFQVASFQSVSGASFAPSAVEARQPTAAGNPVVRKTPGVKQSGEVTLTHCLDRSPAFIDWVQDCVVKRDIEKARQTVTISAIDHKQNPVRSYVLYNCWATEWSSPELKATDDAPAIETLKLAYDDISIR
ncbi:phage tail protein [Streptomyces sp. NPDC002851]